MATNPMHQFEVYRIGPEINLGGINLSFTNSSLFMTISSLTILFLLFQGRFLYHRPLVLLKMILHYF